LSPSTHPVQQKFQKSANKNQYLHNDRTEHLVLDCSVHNFYSAVCEWTLNIFWHTEGNTKCQNTEVDISR
jgi:hypothetical protein